MKIKYYIYFAFVLVQHCFTQTTEWKVYNISTSLIPFNIVRFVSIDSLNNVWIGNYESNPIKFDFKQWTIFDKESPSIYSLQSVFTDKTGKTWVVSNTAGLSCFNKNFWINKSNVKSYSGIYSVDIFNHIWFANADILTDYNDSTGQLINYSASNDYYFTALAIDSNQNIWCGRSDVNKDFSARISKYDKKTWIDFKQIDSSMPFYNIDRFTCIAIDSKNRKWFGSENNGVVSYNDVIWEIFNTKNSEIGSDKINSLTLENDSILWIGTTSGLIKKVRNSWLKFDTSNSLLPSNQVYSINIDRFNNKWIGTNAGLAVFREGGVIIHVDDSKKDTGLEISPNPATDYIYLNLPDGLRANHEVDVVIYNSMGMETMKLSASASGGQMKIDVSALPAGVYFVRCGGELGKFVKE